MGKVHAAEGRAMMDVVLVKIILIGGETIKFAVPGKVETTEQKSLLLDAIAGALTHAGIDVSGVELGSSQRKQ
jgi:hypothetical protein